MRPLSFKKFVKPACLVLIFTVLTSGMSGCNDKKKIHDGFSYFRIAGVEIVSFNP